MKIFSGEELQRKDIGTLQERLRSKLGGYGRK
jgi:hypothetical protein